jgi:hypothetical protein
VHLEQRARRAATGGYSGGGCRGLLSLDGTVIRSEISVGTRGLLHFRFPDRRRRLRVATLPANVVLELASLELEGLDVLWQRSLFPDHGAGFICGPAQEFARATILDPIQFAGFIIACRARSAWIAAASRRSPVTTIRPPWCVVHSGPENGYQAVRSIGRQWVNRVTLTVGRPLPVHPDQRTSSDRPGMSGWCQFRKSSQPSHAKPARYRNWSKRKPP